MNQKEFYEEVKNHIIEYVGPETEVRINPIRKNNGVELNSLLIAEKDQYVIPNIYLEVYYERFKDGELMEELILDIIKTYERTRPDQNIDFDFYEDFEQVKNRISYKLINYERNKELLQKIPHLIFLDLAVVFYCLVENEQMGCGMITIYNDHIQMWNTTVEVLLEHAKKNSLGFKIQDLEEVMREMLIENIQREFGDKISDQNADTFSGDAKHEEEELEYLIDQMLLDMKDDSRTKMYILTNEPKVNGAVCMMNYELLQRFAEQMNSDFYIIPSSIHEVILVPTIGETDSKRLSNMVREVNETQVEEQEVLSDHVYFYSRKQNEIVYA